MKGLVVDIEKETISNENFRKVLFTSNYSQLVLMSLKPQEEIGLEVHGLDQFIKIEQGVGEAILDGKSTPIKQGFAVVVPAGTKHNIINTSQTDMKLYTVYSPPHHKEGIQFKTKEAAQKSDQEFDGETSL